MLLENKDKILASKPNQVKPFGILERTWQYIQRKLKDGRVPKVKEKTMRKIIAFLSSCWE